MHIASACKSPSTVSEMAGRTVMSCESAAEKSPAMLAIRRYFGTLCPVLTEWALAL
jgi:hypothetical protein